MKNKDEVEVGEGNNEEEIEEGDLYETSPNNNNNYSQNLLNNKGKDRYGEEEEEQEEPQEDQLQQNYINENLYDGQNTNDGEDDDRLTYTLITLDLGDLIHIFEENNISFVDMLLLSKDDLKELQLKLYQRNRILNFSTLFNRYAKNYSISEISDFFSFNQKFIFNSSIYDRVISPQNQNDYLSLQNDNENNLENYNNLENEDINNNMSNNENYIDVHNINFNNNNNEQIDFDNISYLDYINYMNKPKKEVKENVYANKSPTNVKKLKSNNSNVKKKNINNNINEIKNNNTNNNNNSTNNYIYNVQTIDWNKKSPSNKNINNNNNKTTDNILKEKNFKKNINDNNNNNINVGINNNFNISNISKSNKKKEAYQTRKINLQQKVQNDTSIDKKRFPSNKSIKKNISNNSNMIVNNSTINNTNSINDTSKSLTKKKSSNKINAVISKYLEIKQDADEFLEKLNKKKNETKNKFNKYNILIKKRQVNY